MPDPILVGRDETKLKQLSQLSGVKEWTTDLDSALADKRYTVYFDAQTTDRRAESVKKAISAGKNIYCEKPTAADLKSAVELAKLAKNAGLKNGVVQDKLWLPGFLKLRSLIDKGFFGKILSVKGDFGYWVFEGDIIAPQRPSWNYRREDGGGIIIDMLCHWRYLIDKLFGRIKAVSCTGATHIPERTDENGKKYKCTADDAAYATFELTNGIICQFNSSWCTRVRRDDLLTVQVDGTLGSAVATLRDCLIQPYGATPRSTWNPDIPQAIDFFQTWQKMPEQTDYDNAFKIQWELFLRHTALNEPFKWDLLEGAKGIQLAEKALESWRERRWIDIPDMDELC
jgi:predicted dehydrogenase